MAPKRFMKDFYSSVAAALLRIERRTPCFRI